VSDRPRNGDEPWRELPRGLSVAALPEGVMAFGHQMVRAIGPAGEQHELVQQIEREAVKHKASRVFLSKCYFRVLPQTYGGGVLGGKMLLEQHYCYATFTDIAVPVHVERRKDAIGEYEERWMIEPPAETIPYRVLDDSWNDDYSARTIRRWQVISRS